MTSSGDIIQKGGIENVSEVWNVRAIFSVAGSGSHIVVSFKDGSHVCTCLKLIREGFPCRHFFRVLVMSNSVQFHVSMIRRRWLMDDSTESTRMNFEPVFNGQHKVENARILADDNFGEILRAIFQNNDQKLASARRSTWKSKMYAKLFGMQKKVLQIALDDESNVGVSKLEAFCEDFIKESFNNTEPTVIKVENPYVKTCKGRPSKKRVKSAHEK
jgi:hypothetical protein